MARILAPYSDSSRYNNVLTDVGVSALPPRNEAPFKISRLEMKTTQEISRVPYARAKATRALFAGSAGLSSTQMRHR